MVTSQISYLKYRTGLILTSLPPLKTWNTSAAKSSSEGFTSYAVTCSPSAPTVTLTPSVSSWWKVGAVWSLFSVLWSRVCPSQHSARTGHRHLPFRFPSGLSLDFIFSGRPFFPIPIETESGALPRCHSDIHAHNSSTNRTVRIAFPCQTLRSLNCVKFLT